jgi:hypothetical protein
MFKLTNTIDIASEMEGNLYKTAHKEESHVERKRIEAAHELSIAATAFEQAGLHKFAEASTILVEKVLNVTASIEKIANINNPDYKYYVIVSGKIESGWEYSEDAKDNAREILEFQPRSAVKIYSLRHLNKIGLDPDDDDNWAGNSSDKDSSILVSEAAKKSKKPAGKKEKKPKNPGKSKDEKEMYRYIGYDTNDIEDSPHGNAGPKGLYYGNAHLPSVYNRRSHEGPGELAREELERGLIDIPDIESSEEKTLEDQFLDMILGGEDIPETEEEIEQITESNEADDIGMIDELFEDV